ncbi:hypothetical protein [Mesorhizobium sp. 10J20-29]
MLFDGRALRAFVLVIASLSSNACTTTPQAVAANPTKVSKSALCRSFVTTQDNAFRQQLYVELSARSITPMQCGEMVTKENQALAVAAVVAVGVTAAAVCANNDCGGGGYVPPKRYGRYGAEWDMFYNQYGQQVWACRDTANGEFTYEYRCAGSARYDHW